jgi:hypothetical protein
MELGAIRSHFIQHTLRRALGAVDGSAADGNSGDRRAADPSPHWKTAYEFRRYFEWYAGSIAEPDREVISYQLRLLEDSCKGTQKQASTESTHR